LEPIKGVDVLLRAVAILSQTRPRIRLVVVGDGSQRRHLITLADSLGISGRVSFEGAVLDVYPFLLRATIGVLPSHSEGQSITLIEMMAAGVPVVATAVGGTPELIEHGTSGLLVPPKDSASLATAIEHTLRDPEGAVRRAEHAQERVSLSFSATSMWNTYLEVYRGSIARSHQGVYP